MIIDVRCACVREGGPLSGIGDDVAAQIEPLEQRAGKRFGEYIAVGR